MKLYEFTVQLTGSGGTPEEAWKEVCEHLNFDGEEEYYIPEAEDIEVIEEWKDDEPSQTQS